MYEPTDEALEAIARELDADPVLNAAAARTAETLTRVPGCKRGHSWLADGDVYIYDDGTPRCKACMLENQADVRARKRTDRVRESNEAAGMTGRLTCLECGHPIRDHAHVWCDLPRREGWVPGRAFAEREAELREQSRRSKGNPVSRR